MREKEREKKKRDEGGRSMRAMEMERAGKERDYNGQIFSRLGLSDGS
jgi:hypothetical protein